MQGQSLWSRWKNIQPVIDSGGCLPDCVAVDERVDIAKKDDLVLDLGFHRSE